jgi:hypothetical protein
MWLISKAFAPDSIFGMHNMELANDKAYQGRKALHLRDSASAEESTQENKRL